MAEPQTFREWMKAQLDDPKFASLVQNRDFEGIAAYLNAPEFIEDAGTGTMMVILDLAEIMGIVTPAEWGTITDAGANWKEVAQVALGGPNPAAAQQVDAHLIRSHGSTSVPLESAVLSILQADDPELAGYLIESLAVAEKISQESAEALAAAMVVPAPSSWIVKPGIAQSEYGNYVNADILVELSGRGTLA